MLILRENPAGIDRQIQRLQERIYNGLIREWGDGIVYNAYGRCYRNKTDDGYIAENYAGNKEYREVYLDDTCSALSFFGVSTSVSAGMMMSGQSHWVMFVDLSQVKPSEALRADEHVRMDVLNLLSGVHFGHQVVSYETGIENVLREYPGSRRDNRMAGADMHPWHSFRINFDFSISMRGC